MSKKLKSNKMAEILDLTANQGLSHESSYVASNGDIISDITIENLIEDIKDDISLKDRLAKIKDIKTDITNLSNFKLNKRSASEANSKGNSVKTSLQNPLIISSIPFSMEIPRCKK